MRRPFIIACAMIACWFTLPVTSAFAQYGGGRGGPGGGGPGGDEGGAGGADDDDAAKKKKDDEWDQGAANLSPLPGSKNAGPCPYVKVLYDAGRYIEFKDDRVASDAVGYTGEFEGLSSGCLYKAADPIHVEVQLLFAFGRGPQASGPVKTYRYWVAVTDRNQEVLSKQYFDIKATFPAGQDRVLMTDYLHNISIPRGDANVSGSNFEVLVGFDVTPEMADFNRLGKRFRVNAGAPAATAQAGNAGSSAQQ
jgi:hypothetical protein